MRRMLVMAAGLPMIGLATIWWVVTSSSPLPRLELPHGGTGVADSNSDPNSSRPRATVYVFLACHCPISNRTIPALNRLAAAYDGAGIRFVGVVPQSGATAEQVAAHHREYGIGFPVVYDRGHSLVERLQATHTPQAIVVDESGQVAYSGRIDDRYADLGRRRTGPVREDLAVALECLATGREISVRQTAPVGCLIEPLDEPAGGDVTFTRDVAPLLWKRCAGCHRPGAIGPFSLLSYEQARAHAQQIGVVVDRRLMPPWKAEGGNFRNQRRLSDSEMETIAAWIAAGAPQGDPAALPPPPRFASDWQLGPPDLELIVPEPFDVPADGPDIYQHFVIPSGLRENRLVRAFEFRPGDPQVVHHATIYLDTTGAARQLDAADPAPGYRRLGSPGFAPSGWLGGWGPGGLPRQLPAGMGRMVWKDSDLVVQIHYHPIGRATRDQSRIGLYFAPPEATQVAGEIMVANVDLEIPAGAQEHWHRAAYSLPVETVLLDITPHMHVLGKQARVTAHRPDGSSELLIDIPDWDFYWQDNYVFAEPVRLPAGTRIELECCYDNSAENPLNPNTPPRTVYWGDFSTDEMGICYLQVTTARWDDFVTLMEHAQVHFDALWEQYQHQKRERETTEPRQNVSDD